MLLRISIMTDAKRSPFTIWNFSLWHHATVTFSLLPYFSCRPSNGCLTFHARRTECCPVTLTSSRCTNSPCRLSASVTLTRSPSDLDPVWSSTLLATEPAALVAAHTHQPRSEEVTGEMYRSFWIEVVRRSRSWRDDVGEERAVSNSLSTELPVAYIRSWRFCVPFFFAYGSCLTTSQSSKWLWAHCFCFILTNFLFNNVQFFVF